MFGRAEGCASSSSRHTPRVILAFDLDCFYASVSVRNDPSLTGLPVGVVQKHLVVTSNYMARGLGVAKMSPVKDAVAGCPQLRLVDGSDLAPFRRAASEVRSAIRQRMPAGTPMEYLGLDEIFIDATDAVAEIALLAPKPPPLQGNMQGDVQDAAHLGAMARGAALAAELRAHVVKETNLTMCAGIGDSKLAAKIATGIHKPDSQTTFISGPKAVEQFLAPKSPRAIPGFGRGYLKRLNECRPDITTVRGLREAFPPGAEAALADALGSSESVAEHLLLACQGIDSSAVVPAGPPKIVSSEDSMRFCKTRGVVREKVLALSREMIGRLVDGVDEHGPRHPGTLQVKFRFTGTGYQPTFRSVSMPLSVSAPTLRNGNPHFSAAYDRAVSDVVKRTLAVLDDNGLQAPPFAFSLLGVGATNFSRSSTARPSLSSSAPFRGDSVLEKRQVEDPTTSCARSQSPRKNEKNVPNGDSVSKRSLEPCMGSDVPASCPVCGKAFSNATANIEINRHLDYCLSGQPSMGLSTRFPKKLGPRKNLTKAKTRHVGSFFTKQEQRR